MNRPTIDKYESLRKYCIALDIYSSVIENALNKACKELAKGTLKGKWGTYGMTEEQWKEWAMKDE